MLNHTACLFPGQGSQSVGMMSAFRNHPLVESTFLQAAHALQYDLWKLIEEGPEETLNQTEYTQPALLAASVAMWRILVERTHEPPHFLAGHSLGEYTALVCADSIEFEDALKTVQKRGQLMQAAVPPGVGGMAALLGLPENKLEYVCREVAIRLGELVQPANFNCPGQVVISGTRRAVELAMTVAQEQGAKRVIALPVSVPAHCALMQPASLQLKQVLESINIRPPTIPVLNHVNVAFYRECEDIIHGLVCQLYSPVRWAEVVSTLFSKHGVTLFLECGPGSVLTGLGKRIAPAAQHLALKNREIYESLSN